jgi:hypothetical protein
MTTAPEVVVLSNVYSQEGTSHRVLKHRNSPSPTQEVDTHECPVEKWKKELSISATAYHSRGREPGKVQSDQPVKTDFQPEKIWNTQTESSVAFHVVGVRTAVNKEKKENDCRSATVTPAIDVVTTESTVCFHRK